LKTTTNLMERPKVDSDPFFKLMEEASAGFRKFQLLSTAFELGVFEALKTPLGAVPLAKKLGCEPTLLPYFCEALCGLGLLCRLEEKPELEEQADSKEAEKSKVKYVNTALSNTYLLKAAPYSQAHFLSEKERDAKIWAQLPEVLTEGPLIFPKADFFSQVVHAMAENASCGALQETVKIITENLDFSKAKKLLDLGGGHGLYAIAFAELYLELEAFVFDLPQVTEETKVYIKKYSADRVRVIPGDFFKVELGKDYDIIFSSFNPGGKVPELLPKIVRALKKGGFFVTRQIPDEKAGANPLDNLAWKLWTFEDTKKGSSSFSFENSVPFSEYVKRLGDYGLEVKKSIDMKDGARIVFAEKRRG